MMRSARIAAAQEARTRKGELTLTFDLKSIISKSQAHSFRLRSCVDKLSYVETRVREFQERVIES